MIYRGTWTPMDGIYVPDVEIAARRLGASARVVQEFDGGAIVEVEVDAPPEVHAQLSRAFTQTTNSGYPE